MAVMYDRTFSCESCEKLPGQAGQMWKRACGCEGPPLDPSGNETQLAGVPFQVGMCPVRWLEDSPDVLRLLNQGSLAQWRMSISEQEQCSIRYVDAFVYAGSKVAEREAMEWRSRSKRSSTSASGTAQS